jgi:hypothetical protein
VTETLRAWPTCPTLLLRLSCCTSYHLGILLSFFLRNRRYLVPNDLTVGQFVYVIRKRIRVSPEKAIFMFVGNVLPPSAALIGDIYSDHKDPDGFLYITYSGENTFG